MGEECEATVTGTDEKGIVVSCRTHARDMVLCRVEADRLKADLNALLAAAEKVLQLNPEYTLADIDLDLQPLRDAVKKAGGGKVP